MKKVVIYVRNKDIRPSDYYRIIQYTKDFDCDVVIRNAVPEKLDRFTLDSHKTVFRKALSLLLCYFFVVLNFISGYVKDNILKPDAIIVIREIFPRKILFFSHLLRKKCKKFNIIWDFDDNIIGNEISLKEAEIYQKYAKRIVVSTPFLKEKLPVEVRKKVDVLCTTDGDLAGIDLLKINDDRRVTYEKEIDIVWVATDNNLPNLIDVCDYLDDAAKKIKECYDKQLTIKVVCNKELEYTPEYLKIDNIKWTRDVAIDTIKTSHIGIMPLIKNEFALGKAGFKLIQYMSCGLPIIASDTGFNSTIVDENVGFAVKQNNGEQWVNAIVSLSADFSVWNNYSVASLDKWNLCYSYESNLEFWKKLIDDIANS